MRYRTLTVRPDVNVAALVPEAFGGFGGIALYCRDLLNALVEQQKGEKVEKVDVLPRLIRDPALAQRQNTRPELKIHGVGSTSLGFLKGLVRMLINRRRYDLVVCGHINLLPFAELIRLRHKAPVLLFIYGIDAWKPTKRRLTNWLCSRVDGVVSISDFTRQKFLAWNRVQPENTYLLPNALHHEQYGMGSKPGYLLRRYGLEGSKVLLTVGRLDSAEQYKGIDEIIDLLPRLLELEPSIKYLVVGDGDDRQRLMKRAEEAGLSRTVVFAGNVPEEEKADHFRLADTFVMTGRGEGFGFVYLEAMSCGIPVVASNRDGSREAVRDGALGLLADPDDPGELEAKIIASLGRPRKVPDGLDFFYYPRFVERLGGILEAVGDRQVVCS